MTDTMTRHVSATLEAELAGPSRIELQLALPHLPGLEVDEKLSVILDGVSVEPREVTAAHDGRVHVVDGVAGRLSVTYSAAVAGAFESAPPGYPGLMTDSNTHSNDQADQSGDDKEMLGAPREGDAGTAEKDPSTWVTGDEPMTGAQRSYLDTLAREAGEQLSPDLNKAEASEQIERLQASTGRGQS